ncbi:MAG: hypothetical protein IH621_13790 [Krumholzibacteria bacterium]|nr:hypothetical protein [Candidatus Krumholzibacteria bacterium]
MSYPRGLRYLSLALILVPALFAFTACDSDSESTTGPETPSDPTKGDLEVSIVEVGEGTDADGYTLQIDGTPAAIQAGMPLRVDQLAPGAHTLQLEGLGPDCRVLGANPREVTVTAGGETRALFEVACGGDLVIGRAGIGLSGAYDQYDPPTTVEISVVFGSPNPFDGIVLTPADLGVVTTIDSGASYDALLALLTNGEPDVIETWCRVPGIAGVGTHRSDFDLPSFLSDSDFAGASIQSISIRLDRYDVVSFGDDLGFSYDIELSLRFHGDPPSTARVLGSFGGQLEGTAPIDAPTDSTAAFSFGVGLDPETELVVGDVFDGVAFDPSDQSRRFLVGVNDDADFDALLAALTNGVDDCLGFRLSIDVAEVVHSGCIAESEIVHVGDGPDFAGATITGVRLVVEEYAFGYVTKAGEKSEDYFIDYRLEVVGIPAADPLR